MKRTLEIACTLLLICMILVGCGHKHVWTEADCTSPKTCQECGETEGEALGHEWKEATCTEPKTCSQCRATEGETLGHDWVDATCTDPKTCSRCGTTEGEALGHDWADATCTDPKTCSRCGTTEGEALGHDWIEATCTEPKTCSRCGEPEGEALGHNVEDLTCTESAVCSRCGEEIPALGHEWVEATCSDPKTCSRCGSTEGEALGHTKGEPQKENQKAATCTEDGTYDEVVYCTVCNEELSRETKTEPALGHSTSNGICSRCGLEIYEPVNGQGDDVITDINIGEGLYRVHFTNNGSRNFAVWVYDKNEDRDLAVNEIGNYDGYYFLLGKAPFTFEITSSGSWSYTIEPLVTTDDTSFEGKGDYVTNMFSADTGVWYLTHDGSSNFVVYLYTADGRDLIVNEIGYYEGKKRLSIPSDSKALLAITADGNWSISPSN